VKLYRAIPNVCVIAFIMHREYIYRHAYGKDN
jgi:hypothetical protein